MRCLRQGRFDEALRQFEQAEAEGLVDFLTDIYARRPSI
jgi:hypothetical protein